MNQKLLTLQLAISVKTCTKCNKTKPYECFPKRNTKNGYRNQCKDCRNASNKTYYDSDKRAEWHLKATYGITLEDYDKMLEEQEGLCANPSCYNTEKEGKRLHVDHNHRTGEVRGLLCNGCNTAAGLAQDNPEILEGLAQYLKDRGYYG